MSKNCPHTMFILCIKFDEDQLLHLLTSRMAVPYPCLELWRRVETAAVATIGICPYGTYCSSKHLPHKAVVGTIETSFVLGAKNGSSWQFLSIYLSIYLSICLSIFYKALTQRERLTSRAVTAAVGIYSQGRCCSSRHVPSGERLQQ